ncbi:bL17 family ribosomal protein [Roseimaritima ulvae]|uniref:Large ribosomal subunit protein bL17 n=1 Tax=Roseimaritima ulvae TaxID=980254 RepID=A0A5B9QWJ0_9BACT|nr:L17 family ribosomal protein [Roseimaritima ulvae]QEG42160.1 50S ribosomal protein L17 [Roseimaritima ulvae]
MRHRRRGRVLGRSPSHRKALFKNMASALFLTERDAEFDDNAPKVKGRIITTVPKAKELRPLVEKCITIAKKSLASAEEAEQYATDAERGSDEYKAWRKSENWRKWADARAPMINARRRCLQLLGDKQAVNVLFDTVAQRYVDRPGGYTRVIRLAKPRLGDAGQRAMLELVGVNDRVRRSSERPAFEDDDSNSPSDETPVSENADTETTETAEAGEAETSKDS